MNRNGIRKYSTIYFTQQILLNNYLCAKCWGYKDEVNKLVPLNEDSKQKGINFLDMAERRILAPSLILILKNQYYFPGCSGITLLNK